MVTAAIGLNRDVQHILIFGAAQSLAFATLPDEFATAEGVPDQKLQQAVGQNPQLLLRALCSGVDPTMATLYAEMVQLIALKGGSLEGFIVGMEQEANSAASDMNRPKAFFQVAIDVPGFGETQVVAEGGNEKAFSSAKLLHEIIAALGKDYAFAIVAHSAGAANVLNAVLQMSGLSSFLVLREPIISDQLIDSLHLILHPVLAPYDPDGATQQVRTVRNLNTVLPQVSSPKISLAKAPKYFQQDLADDIFSFFESHEWHGAMAGHGHSAKL
eukprot:3430897-Prymnesium_polylepis.2